MGCRHGPASVAQTRRLCRGSLGAACRCALGRRRLEFRRAGARRRARRARAGCGRRPLVRRSSQSAAHSLLAARVVDGRGPGGAALGERRLAATWARERVVFTSARRGRARRRRAVFRLRGAARRASSASPRSSVSCATWARSSWCDSTTPEPARCRRARRARGARERRRFRIRLASASGSSPRRTRAPFAATPMADVRQRVGMGREVWRRRSTSTAAPSATSSRGLRRRRAAAIVFAVARRPRVWRARPCLNGSIDLEPLQKLSAVFALTDLTYLARRRARSHQHPLAVYTPSFVVARRATVAYNRVARSRARPGGRWRCELVRALPFRLAVRGVACRCATHAPVARPHGPVGHRRAPRCGCAARVQQQSAVAWPHGPGRAFCHGAARAGARDPAHRTGSTCARKRASGSSFAASRRRRRRRQRRGASCSRPRRPTRAAPIADFAVEIDPPNGASVASVCRRRRARGARRRSARAHGARPGVSAGALERRRRCRR